nr:hypothetical protein GCM10025699_63570 [Microbacterium flavescens]
MSTVDVVTPVDTSVPTGLGAPVARLEGRDKVTGAARYAYEHTPDGVLYGWIAQSSVTTGTIMGSNRDEVLRMPGVRAVVMHDQAPHLEDAEDGELLVLQSAAVAYRGQPVALVLADTFDTAREAASALRVEYDEGGIDVVLSTDHPTLYAPETVNAGFETDTSQGDVDAAMADSSVTIDETYETAALFNSPMEPHATVATWVDGRLDVLDSNQGTSGVATSLATLFSLDPAVVRVRAQHVGGGFGSKGSARPVVVLASIGAMLSGRPVKLAYTRQMMFSLSGYRTPTISRIRLAADSGGICRRCRTRRTRTRRRCRSSPSRPPSRPVTSGPRPAA